MTKQDFNFSKKKVIQRKFCILCENKNLDLVIDFGKTPLANSYPKTSTEKENYFKLRILLCRNCGHAQLKDIVDPKLMFQNYLYVSGTSKVLVSHFESLAKKVIGKYNLKKNDKIVDIACNDGTLLKFFVKKKFKNVIGIDPAKNLRKLNLDKKIDINTIFFTRKSSDLMKKKYGKFKLITANNVCAHIPDLNDFFDGIKNVLSKDGVFIFEVSYLLEVIKKLYFDTVYHEHMSYHAIKPLIGFLKKKGLQLFDFDLIPVQGGSIRVYVSHINAKKVNSNKINKQILIEKKNNLFSKIKYKKYYLKIQNQKIKLRKIINFFLKKGYKIAGYGAPAKLTTFSHVLDIKKTDLKFIIDDNPLKQNRYSPGKKIKILNASKLEKEMPDIILVLAWNFYKSIKEKCKSILGKKIKFIKPFPKPFID